MPTRPSRVRSLVTQTAPRAIYPTPAQLQRHLGNRGTQAWLMGQAPVKKIQLKNQPDEMYERKDLEEEELLQRKFDPTQTQGLEEEDELLQAKFAAIEAPTQFQGGADKAENYTGMPDPLKAGLEQLSGMDLSGVQVLENSPKPAQLDALAYTQGQEIHLGPGQKKHLPHEGWHAVQQMQGRVEPTVQAKGVSINDDAGLEREADVMGAKALHMKRAEQVRTTSVYQGPMPLQRKAATSDEWQASRKVIGLSGKNVRLNSLPTEIEAEIDSLLLRTGGEPKEADLRHLGRLAVSALGPKGVTSIARKAGVHGADRREKEVDTTAKGTTQRQAAEAAGGVAATMWWLTLVDGPLPIGDLIYGALILGAAITAAVAMSSRGRGNVADTGIMQEVNDLIAAGLAATVCAALEVLMRAAQTAGDTERIKRIKRTQKAKGCRRSRNV